MVKSRVVEARLPLFKLDVMRYAQRFGETLSTNMQVGIMLSQRDEGALKQHLLWNSSRSTDWNVFNKEMLEIRRVQATR